MVQGLLGDPLVSVFNGVGRLIRRVIPILARFARWLISLFTRWWTWAVFAWRACMASRHPALWAVSFAGATVGAAAFLICTVLLRDGGLSMAVGIPVSFIALAWLFGEVASFRQRQEALAVAGESEEIPMEHVRPLLQHGRRSVRSLLVFLGVLVVAAGGEMVLDLMGGIPYIGPSILGLAIVPDVFASLIAIMAGAVVLLGATLVPAELLFNDHDKLPVRERVVALPKSLLVNLKRTGLVRLAVAVPALVASALLSVIPAIIVGVGVFVSYQILGSAVDVWPDVAQGTGALQRAFGQYGDLLHSGLPGALFASVGLGALVGVVTAPFFASLACLEYSLHNRVLQRPQDGGPHCYELYTDAPVGGFLGDVLDRARDVGQSAVDHADEVASAAQDAVTAAGERIADAAQQTEEALQEAVREGVAEGDERFGAKEDSSDTA
jgi:hypothetical protein